MTDKEKLIHELECQIADAELCDNEWKDNVPIWVLRDAWSLLKEQEPKKVLSFVISAKVLSGFCPKCNHTLMHSMNEHFCGFCGQKVKWE